ncbi:MAG: 30S ribosomal protein S18 [Pseudomonadota bacterium]
MSLVNQAVFVRKRKSCPLKNLDIAQINYKNLKLLNKFLTERGKIIPARATNVSMKKQRALSNAIKVARQLALLSPIDKQDS